MIIYDCRTGEWRKWKKLSDNFLAPELYFEIGKSDDGEEHHIFETNLGTKEFIGFGEEITKEYKKLVKQCSYVIRKKWLLPKEKYEAGLKHFKLMKEEK